MNSTKENRTVPTYFTYPIKHTLISLPLTRVELVLWSCLRTIPWVASGLAGKANTRAKRGIIWWHIYISLFVGKMSGMHRHDMNGPVVTPTWVEAMWRWRMHGGTKRFARRRRQKLGMARYEEIVRRSSGVRSPMQPRWRRELGLRVCDWPTWPTTWSFCWLAVAVQLCKPWLHPPRADHWKRASAHLRALWHSRLSSREWVVAQALAFVMQVLMGWPIWTVIQKFKNLVLLLVGSVLCSMSNPTQAAVPELPRLLAAAASPVRCCPVRPHQVHSTRITP
jgi:hypothetical protein